MILRYVSVFSNPIPRSSDHQKSLLKDLKPSETADHKYHLEGEAGRLLRRTLCTDGTRVRILRDIETWANDTSSGSETVYWLFGPAGSGKSTIAYTIAHSIC
jgi:polynucleotide 5'-kinase involved in rRNA processing